MCQIFATFSSCFIEAFSDTLIIPGGGVNHVDGGHDVGDGVQVAGDVQLEHRGQELAQTLLK